MSEHRQIKKSRRLTPWQWAVMFLVVSVIALVLVLIFRTPVGQQTTQPAAAVNSKVVSNPTPHKITLEVTGNTSIVLWNEGPRHTHDVVGPFKVTKKIIPGYQYGIQGSLSAEDMSNGNITATILVDGKVVSQDKTGPNKTWVSAQYNG